MLVDEVLSVGDEKFRKKSLEKMKNLILDRLNIIKPTARMDAESELDSFIDSWKLLASQPKKLRYYVVKTDSYNRLMNNYGEKCSDSEKPTLRSMREVENAANMFYYTED